MTHRYLGWDCANKSLAWSYLVLDVHIYSKLDILADHLVSQLWDYFCCEWGSEQWNELLQQNIQDTEFIQCFMDMIYLIDFFLNNFIKVESWGCADILSGRNIAAVSDADRALLLYNWLEESPMNISSVAAIPTTVIIERQPARIGIKTNNRSSAVSSQLTFYYARMRPYLIHPRAKNNLSIAPHLIFTCRGLNTRARYIARKKHSIDSFLHLVRVFKLPRPEVSKANLDDLADATMQIFAYLVMNRQFI